MKYILATLLILLGAGCISPPIEAEELKFYTIVEEPSNHYSDVVDDEDHFSVIHDDIRNVTCWIIFASSRGSASGGISCIPDSQLVNHPQG